LEDFLNELSEKLDRLMSSQETFEALSDEYHQELMSAHGIIAVLKRDLLSVMDGNMDSNIKLESISLAIMS